jgi:4-aminobutyrate aminotransferase-like enzyme
MANGTPIGATIATAEIADSMKGMSISTFGGNPVASVAALATIEVVEEENLVENARVMGKRLRDGLEALKIKYHPVIGDVRGMGLMQGLELVGENKQPQPEATGRLFEATKTNGLLIGKGGLAGNVIRITPPLNVTADQIDQALKMLDRSFGRMGL